MSNKPRKIVVWSWSRDPSIIPIERLISEGKVEVALWVSMLGDKDQRAKPFSYVPGIMLDELQQRAKRNDVYYGQSAEQLNTDLTKFIDLYSRVNYAKGRDIFEQINLFHLYYQYFTHLLKTQQVDAVVYFGAPHVGVDYILYLAAKGLGIDTIVTMQSFVPNRFFCVRDLDDYGRFDSCKELGEPITLTVPNAFEKEHFYMAKIKNKHSLRLHKFFEDCMRAIFPSRQPISWAGVWQNMGARIDYRRNYKKHIREQADLNCRFVYFPLQMQPELTTSLLGKEYGDQLYAIEKLSQMLPSDWKIYVKENPKQSPAQRGSLFFERLGRIPNAEYIGTSVDTYDLIKASQFVASVTGTACWESITGGKPALIFGQIWYMSLPGITVYTDGVSVEQVMTNRFEHEELERAHSELHGRSIPGIIGVSYAALYKEFDEQVNAGLLTDFLRKVLQLG